jgi:hypothetical protein
MIWPFNPGRALSKLNQAKRDRSKREQQVLRREVHDALTEQLGLPPIPWARRA